MPVGFDWSRLMFVIERARVPSVAVKVSSAPGAAPDYEHDPPVSCELSKQKMSVPISFSIVARMFCRSSRERERAGYDEPTIKRASGSRESQNLII